MKTEKDLENYLKKQCTKHGFQCYKFSSPSRRGVPDDLVVAYPDIKEFIELKSPSKTGRLSALQEVEINLLRQMECVVWVADDKEGVDGFIEHVKRKQKRAMNNEI